MSAGGRIPAYYINLASRPDRRAYMEEQLQRLGISAERIEATTTDDVTADRLAPHLDPRNSTSMSRIEIACLMSHERAWRRFLATGADHALILEDDLVMSEGLSHFLDSSLHRTLGVDLMKLETFYQRIHLGRDHGPVGDRWSVRALLSSHLGTAAYVISKRRAARALTDPLLATMPVDCYLFDKRGPVVPAPGIFQVDPAPTVQFHLYRGENPTPIGRSDMDPDRKAFDAARPLLISHRLQMTMAQLRYKIRTIVQTIRDVEAMRIKRRVVPFANDPSE